jgi:hypothetical protein
MDIVQRWNVDCNGDTLWYWILFYFGTEYATSDTQIFKGEIDVILSNLYDIRYWWWCLYKCYLWVDETIECHDHIWYIDVIGDVAKFNDNAYVYL